MGKLIYYKASPCKQPSWRAAVDLQRRMSSFAAPTMGISDAPLARHALPATGYSLIHRHNQVSDWTSALTRLDSMLVGCIIILYTDSMQRHRKFVCGP